MKLINVSSRALIVGGVVIAAFAVGRVSAAAFPSPGQELFYSGQLTNTDGTPRTSTQDLSVQLFNDPVGGSVLCSTTVEGEDLSRSNGHFRIQLPTACVDAVADNDDVYAQFVAGTTVFPRQQLGASAYAVSARDARQAEQALTANTALTVVNGGVGASAIGTGVINSSHIADGSITTADLGAITLDGDDIENGTVGTDAIAANAVVTSKIASAAITGTLLASDVITSDKIPAGAVLESDISPLFVSKLSALTTRVQVLESRRVLMAQVRNCTGATCSVIRQSPEFISSVQRGGAGDYQINLNSAASPDANNCVVLNAGRSSMSYNARSAVSIGIDSRTYDLNNSIDTGFDVICVP